MGIAGRRRRRAPRWTRRALSRAIAVGITLANFVAHAGVFITAC